jgi:hypothetical protein
MNGEQRGDRRGPGPGLREPHGRERRLELPVVPPIDEGRAVTADGDELGGEGTGGSQLRRVGLETVVRERRIDARHEHDGLVQCELDQPLERREDFGFGAEDDDSGRPLSEEGPHESGRERGGELGPRACHRQPGEESRRKVERTRGDQSEIRCAVALRVLDCVHHERGERGVGMVPADRLEEHARGREAGARRRCAHVQRSAPAHGCTGAEATVVFMSAAGTLPTTPQPRASAFRLGLGFHLRVGIEGPLRTLKVRESLS